MRTLTLLIAAASALPALACDHWTECDSEAAWHVPLHLSPGDAAVWAQAARGADGSVLLHIDPYGYEPGTQIAIGDRTLRLPVLARIESDGTVAAAIPGHTTRAVALRTDPLGRSVVVWQDGRVASYTADLQERWTSDVLESAQLDWSFDAVDLGPSGELAIATGGELIVIEPDGSERFRQGDVYYTYAMRFDPDGDIVAVDSGYGDGYRLERRSGQDGALISTTSVPLRHRPLALYADGLLAEANGNDYDEEDGAVLERLDATGNLMWSLPLGRTGEWADALGGRVRVTAGRDGDAFIVRGDESVTGYLSWTVTRVDGATGATLSSTRLCDGDDVIGGDRNGFVTITIPSDGGAVAAGVSFFEAPRPD